MTRSTIDPAILLATGTAGVATILPTAFTTMIGLVNEHAASLDTIGAPTTGAPTETKTSGAATLTTLLTRLSTTGTVAYSLADGTVDGQRHIFEEITAASTPQGTLTVATMDTAGGGVNATFVFNAVGQRLELVWNGSAWHVERLVPAGQLAVVVGTTVLTGFVMNASMKLSVTGTVHSTSTKGIPNGRISGQRLHIGTGTAASSPVGDIAVTAITRTAMAAATSLANLTDTTMSLELEWNGAAWQATEFTAGSGTATLS